MRAWRALCWGVLLFGLLTVTVAALHHTQPAHCVVYTGELCPGTTPVSGTLPRGG